MKFEGDSTTMEEPSLSEEVTLPAQRSEDQAASEGATKKKRHHHRRKSVASIGDPKNDEASEDKATRSKDLDVAARAAAESVDPVESAPAVSPSGKEKSQQSKNKSLLVRKVIKYDSDGEVDSVTELPATKNAVVHPAANDDSDDASSIEPEKKKQRRETDVGLITTDQKTPEKKKRRRRRKSRKSMGDMPDSKESAQTNVSVFMDIDHPPVCSAPCSDLLDPANTILSGAAANKKDDKEEPVPEKKVDYSHYKTVEMDEVKEGDLIAWGDVVMENSRPSLVWHDGILVKKTPSIVSVAKPGGDIAETTEVAVNTMFCLKCVKPAQHPNISKSSPSSKQEAPSNEEPKTATSLPPPLPRVSVRTSRPHPNTAAVSGVVSFLRRMGAKDDDKQ